MKRKTTNNISLNGTTHPFDDIPRNPWLCYCQGPPRQADWSPRVFLVCVCEWSWQSNTTVIQTNVQLFSYIYFHADLDIFRGIY